MDALFSDHRSQIAEHLLGARREFGLIGLEERVGAHDQLRPALFLYLLNFSGSSGFCRTSATFLLAFLLAPGFCHWIPCCPHKQTPATTPGTHLHMQGMIHRKTAFALRV